MIRNDQWITQEALKGMVQDFDPSRVNPNSLDLELGSVIKIMCPVESEEKGPAIAFDYRGDVVIRERPIKKVKWVALDISDFTKRNPLYVPPGLRFLACSRRVINLPDNVAAIAALKSSRAREYWEHLNAGFCDSGWHGSTLTMEFINHSLGDLPIYPGLRVMQLIFMAAEVPMESYSKTGRYNGDLLPTESKG